MVIQIAVYGNRNEIIESIIVEYTSTRANIELEIELNKIKSDEIESNTSNEQIERQI